MKITIVITLLNDKRVLKTLESLTKQSLKPDEVIVADGGSKKELISKIKKFEKYDYIKLHHIPGTIAESRNKTMKIVNGDIIVFIDSDEIAPEDWLDKITKPIREKKADFTGGKYYPLYKPKTKCEKYVNDSTEWRWNNLIKKDTTTIFMGNSAWKKEIFEKIGNFDEKLKWGGEDYDINIRADQHGFKGKFVEDAWLYHDQSQLNSIEKILRKHLKYYTGTTIAYLKNDTKGKKRGAAKVSLGFFHPIELANLLLKVIAFVIGYRLYKKIYDGEKK